MTSKSTSDFQLSGAYRLFAAFFAIAALTGCAPDFRNLGPCAVCFGPPTQVSLEGTLSGLVGSGLQLQNNAAEGPQFNGAASNGTAVVFISAPFNAAYNLTVQTQPTNPSQTCVVTNGTGTAGTSDVTNIAVTCTTNPPRFAYVANRGSNNVSAYSVDATTGALTAIAGSPFAAGKLPVAIAVDSTGSYAYIANQTDATISAFLIDRSTGALTEARGSPFTTGSAPTSVAIDASSSFVYVTNSGVGTISVYAIAGGTGELAAAPGSPFAVGGSPSSVTLAPLGGYNVFVADQSSSNVSIYASPFNGALALSPNSPIATGMGSSSVAGDASFNLYVANAISNTLSGFTGTDLVQTTATAGSPYSTGTTPTSVTIDPLDNFVYVANQGSNNISAFALDPTTGALTIVAGSPFAAGKQPSSVAVDPTGMFAYAVNAGADSVSVYAIDAPTGALSPIGGSSIATGTQPTAIAISD
jgi:6-phosphogluconolactonase